MRMSVKKEGKKQNKISVNRTVWTSLFVDVVDVVLNLIVAIITGSVVMLAETLQGISDFISVLFVLIGLKRSENKSKKYPFGYERVLYVWILFSAIVMIFFAAGLSIYFGVRRIIFPEEISYIFLTYIILSISVISNGYAFSVSSRRLLDGKKFRHLYKCFNNSNLVATRTTFILDSMGTLAAIFGLIALILYGLTGDFRFDGIGAVSIGLILIFLSLSQVKKTKDLLVGKGISRKMKNEIINEVLNFKEIKNVKVQGISTGLEKFLIILNLKLRDNLKKREIVKITNNLKRNLLNKFAFIKYIKIEIN